MFHQEYSPCRCSRWRHHPSHPLISGVASTLGMELICCEDGLASTESPVAVAFEMEHPHFCSTLQVVPGASSLVVTDIQKAVESVASAVVAVVEMALGIPTEALREEGQLVESASPAPVGLAETSSLGQMNVPYG